MKTKELNNETECSISNVKFRLANDGEILINVPENVFNYYHNLDEFKKSFTEDAWYCSGIIGEVSPEGLRIVKQKNNTSQFVENEKNISTILEKKCHYISSSLIIGAEGKYPIAILFPNKQFLLHPNYEISPLEGCFCPKNQEELSKCFSGCLNDANGEIGNKFSKVKMFLVVEVG